MQWVVFSNWKFLGIAVYGCARDMQIATGPVQPADGVQYANNVEGICFEI